AETGEVLRSSLANFTSGLGVMTYESVKVWIEGGRVDRQQIRSVAQSALLGYYGDHNESQDSFLSFSLDAVLESWAHSNSQTWENLVSNVTIRTCDVKDHFEWQDRRTYTLVCPSKSGQVKLQLEGSAQVHANDVLTALDRLEYNVRF